MKKLISLVVCFTCVFSLFACSKEKSPEQLPQSEFVDTKVTDNYVIDLYEDYAEIVEYTGKSEEVEIISEYESLPVKSVGDFAFKNLNDLKKVVVPSSVLRIGEYAFSSCKNLEEVVINNGVTEICSNAFEFCASLKSINIPDSVVAIGSMAFFDCEEIESVTLPRKIDKIGGGAFSYTKWESSFNEDFVFVGDNVLVAYLGSDEEVTLPDNTKHVSAFYENYSLKKVVFNKGLETVGDKCFCDCGELEEVLFSSTVKTIGNNAFVWCQSLKNIELPSSLKKIDDEAFSDCISIEKITIPSSVETVGMQIFQRCDGLKDVTFENPSLKMEHKLFSNKNVDVTVHASAGSIVEEYCKKNEYKFEAI